MELNKIYFADSYKAIKNVPDGSIDCIYTDVPYAYDFSKKSTSECSTLSKQIRSVTDELTDANITKGFDMKILNDFLRIMKDGKINIFVWVSKKQILPVTKWFADHTDASINYLVWCKTNPTPMCNNSWLPDLEYCLHFRKNVKFNNGYHLKSKFYVSKKNKEDKDLYGHPTIKPLELVERHLLETTQPNDVVFDPFSGSGTTAVAAKRTGRRFLAFENYKPYYDKSIDRLKDITQLKRKMLADGYITLFK